jgi:hypothetical protein
LSSWLGFVYTCLTPSSSQVATWNVGVWVKSNGSTAQYDTIVSSANFNVIVPTISVTSATYGGNCGAPAGNVTSQLAAACNGRTTCSYTIDYRVLGDPAPGCAKNYVAQWKCGTNPTVRSVTAPAEAGFGSVVTLTCN